MPARQDTAEIRLDALERTASGAIRVPAVLTRAGVFPYTRSDGSVVREWRPEEEVLREDSMRSLEDVPVTIGHPREGVNPDNHGAVAAGHVRAGVKRADGMPGVQAVLQVSRRDARDKVEARAVHDISCGYDVRLDNVAGVVPAGHADAGQSYDRVQRDIVYNHVALLKRGDGRQGTACSLRLDGAENQIAMTNDAADTANEETDEEMSDEDKAKKKKKGANPFEKKADAEKARADAAEAALAARARADLEASARKVLGAEAKFDAKETDRAIRERVLTAAKVRFDAADTDVKIEARYDVAIDTLPANREDGDTHKILAALNGATPGAEDPLAAARARAMKARADSADLWKSPRK